VRVSRYPKCICQSKWYTLRIQLLGVWLSAVRIVQFPIEPRHRLQIKVLIFQMRIETFIECILINGSIIWHVFFITLLTKTWCILVFWRHIDLDLLLEDWFTRMLKWWFPPVLCIFLIFVFRKRPYNIFILFRFNLSLLTFPSVGYCRGLFYLLPIISECRIVFPINYGFWSATLVFLSDVLSFTLFIRLTPY